MHLVGLHIADKTAENTCSDAQHARAKKDAVIGAICAFILHPGRTLQSDALVIDRGSPA